MNTIIALIIAIAIEMGIPSWLAVSIALEENPTLNPLAVNENENGTFDRGIFQLNSSWYNDEFWFDPETNIRAGCAYIKELMCKPGVNTWWSVAVCYNAGYGRLNNPPETSIEYAGRVISRWRAIDGRSFQVLTGGRR